jgi:hypothetical protein
MRHKLQRVVSRFRLARRPHGTSAQRRLITEFAERSNMVYFGFVSQLIDEHRIVRGLTVSTKHHDQHYCIGTYHGYDVVFVERTDTLLTSGHTHTWHIMEFDLSTTADLPHIFIGSPVHGNGFHSLLKAKYSSMLPVSVGATGVYPNDFTNYFRLYTNPAHAVRAEQLIDPETAAMIGRHFKGLVVEIVDNALYVYSEKTHISGSLLDTMLANGVWLARRIDEKSQLL